MTTAPTTLLLLGGTGWLGPEVARQARDRGVQVTTLNRGRSGAGVDGVEAVVGDRSTAGGYDGVRGRDWDLVLDTTWQPGMARSAVEALSECAGWWCQVGTTGSYAAPTVRATERSATVPALVDDEADNSTYTRAKIACEQAITTAMPDRSLIARSGLLCGPGDRSDRFGYWPARLALVGDGAVLVPRADDQPVQVYDARDLAIWLVDSALERRTGVVNAVGPTWSLGEVINQAWETTGGRADLVSADASWLREHDVRPWMGPRSLPLWQPDVARAGAPLVVDDEAIVATGRPSRGLDEIVRDCLDYERGQGLDRDRADGLTRADEEDLLAALT